MVTPKIDSYQFGKIVIDGHTYHKDVMITPDGVVPNWWRREGHSLCLEDLQNLLLSPPQELVIGQGAYGRMAVPLQVRRELEARGIHVRTLPTGEAWRIFNELRDQGNVAAALHLTC